MQVLNTVDQVCLFYLLHEQRQEAINPHIYRMNNDRRLLTLKLHFQMLILLLTFFCSRIPPDRTLLHPGLLLSLNQVYYFDCLDIDKKRLSTYRYDETTVTAVGTIRLHRLNSVPVVIFKIPLYPNNVH